MTPSQMLEEENKKMEDKLKLVQQMVQMEKEARSSKGMKPASATASASSRWVSSNQPANQARAIMEQHKKALAAGLKPKVTPSPAPTQSAKQGMGNPFTDGI